MRYVIALDTALRLFRERTAVPASSLLVAPTLLRSQALAHLYAAFRRGDIERKEAAAQLDHMRSLKIRLLGDRVQQQVAWEIASRLGWPDTTVAEYLALVELQADAFVTLDHELARSLHGVVPLAGFDEMLAAR
jgi:predicted nucleic acid-binding protein